MQRIGLTASKIAKGNIWTYHCAVILISLLFAVFTFLVCGFCIAMALFILFFVLQRFIPSLTGQTWVEVLRICLSLLGGLIGIMTVVAILKNVKLKSKI